MLLWAKFGRTVLRFGYAMIDPCYTRGRKYLGRGEEGDGGEG